MFFLCAHSRIFRRTAAFCSVFLIRSHTREAARTFSYTTDATLEQKTSAPIRDKSIRAGAFPTPIKMVELSNLTASSVSDAHHEKHCTGSAPTQAAIISGARGNASTQPLFLGQRVWDETPNWCSLCVEPLNIWNEHIGKREHICLEMFYDALIQYERRWDPCDIWADADDVFCHTTLSREAHNTAEEPRSVSPSFSSALDCAYRAFDQGTRARRHELVACLKYLVSCGIIQLTTSNLNHASFIGSLVLFKEQFLPLSKLFPLATAKDVSCLTQMIATSYNFETVFDLCRMEALVSEELLQARRALSPRPQTTDTAHVEVDSYGDNNGSLCSIAGGFPSEFDADDGACEKTSDGRISYGFKGVFCRALLGALRWALEPDSGDPPTAITAPELAHKSGPYAVLAAHTARLLVSEIIDCKLTEYVVRVEGVFREERGLAEAAMFRFGNCKIFHPHAPAEPRKKRKRKKCDKAQSDAEEGSHQANEETKRELLRLARMARAIGQSCYAGRSDVVPSLPNWGMLQYMDGTLFYNEALRCGKHDTNEVIPARTRRLVSNG